MDCASGSRGPSSSLRLSFEAKGLRNRDMLSKSDPMLVIYGRTANGREAELGRTEVIENSLNPRWVYEIQIEYHFEEIQPLHFVIYDVDSDFKNKSSEQLKLNKQEFLGETRTTLAEIVASPPHVLTTALQGRTHDMLVSRGHLTVRSEEVSTSARSEELDLVFRCADLENQEMFSKSDPFLRISRMQPDGTATPVYQTEEIKNNLNPKWKPIQINLQQLCNGDKDRKLLLECFDYENTGKHKLIGVVASTVNQMVELSQARTPVNLTRPSSNKKHGATKNRGKLFVEICNITPLYSFLDYVFGGCEISFFVAVDFTASNGDPRQPGSLHYIDPMGRYNAYQTAIQTVGGVLQYYDSDKRFTCWGFGGRPDRRTLSHCFPLNNNVNNPDVDGIDGILAAYSQAVYSVELYGPTWFAPVIRMAASIASQYARQLKYFVLLIITDGAILDMDDTIAAIVDASDLPLSLLIVGVGNADFSAMDTLDSDNKALTTRQGRVAVRDIVQFVPIRSVTSLEHAAKELLRELPRQLLSYMKTHRVSPVRTVDW